MQAHRAEQVRNGKLDKIVVPIPNTRRVTYPPEKRNSFKGLQRAKRHSSIDILGPRHVVDAEVFGGRAWQGQTSSDSVPIEVSYLRRRALVAS
jgi:hypothetical protein